MVEISMQRSLVRRHNSSLVPHRLAPWLRKINAFDTGPYCPLDRNGNCCRGDGQKKGSERLKANDPPQRMGLAFFSGAVARNRSVSFAALAGLTEAKIVPAVFPLRERNTSNAMSVGSFSRRAAASSGGMVSYILTT